MLQEFSTAGDGGVMNKTSLLYYLLIMPLFRPSLSVVLWGCCASNLLQQLCDEG